MEKFIFNTLSRQAKELEKTAKNTLIEYLNKRKNLTYQTDKFNTENIITLFGGRSYSFVGCYIDKKETLKIHKGLKLLGYLITNCGEVDETIDTSNLFEIELYNFDNIQLLNALKYINEYEFSED